ncbi:MAG TPA: hypothetical protein PKM48_10115 [Parvularculaceae bacterium]|nr:hypothetical protein [Parvularculaceae bacterium]HNS87040.1 hypothetical protein [Parvularculaceae bacterium]
MPIKASYSIVSLLILGLGVSACQTIKKPDGTLTNPVVKIYLNNSLGTPAASNVNKPVCVTVKCADGKYKHTKLDYYFHSTGVGYKLNIVEAENFCAQSVTYSQTQIASYDDGTSVDGDYQGQIYRNMDSIKHCPSDAEKDEG